jgi:hypothetical protein
MPTYLSCKITSLKLQKIFHENVLFVVGVFLASLIYYILCMNGYKHVPPIVDIRLYLFIKFF